MSEQANVDLSQNEARVLHSLIKWPDLADNEIHGRIGMKKSTFSSIKNRLKENDYYRRYFVPNFPILGFELNMIQFGELNRFSNHEERERVAGKMLREFNEDILQISENNHYYSISVSENYSEYSKNLEAFNKVFIENRFLSRDGLQVIAYPFEISRIHSFLDYESIVAKIFGFAALPYSERVSVRGGKVKKVKLTKAQRKVFMGLIKHPDETDTLIADEVGVSRNTVANAKRKFLSSELLLPRVVPNLTKLGMTHLVFQFRRFNPKISQEKRDEAVDLIRTTLNPFFFVSKNSDGYLLSAHTSLEEFEILNRELTDFYARQEYLIEDPIIGKLSLEEMNATRDYIFIDLMAKKLKFEKEKPLSMQD
ncbi:MAG: hypothetical protein ACXAE3_01955 [Candidatus Kariarchaeaceae archaeon]|jgi:DNA-binding Lrp family transcriptional regulator